MFDRNVSTIKYCSAVECICLRYTLADTGEAATYGDTPQKSKSH